MPPASNTIVLKSLSVLLGLFFIFVGTLKLTPHISKDLYKDLRTEYVKYAKVFPLTALFGVKIPSKWYRRTVGILEIVCGLAMALIPYHKVKNAANITLLVLMLLGIYQHWMVSDPFERSGPALVFTFMLGGRLVVWYQTARLQDEASTTTQPPANGVKQD
ncbi:transmembrane protein 35A [Drosophila eugracilis]|uniref:transmembrane protein 35A n=1 Tax=Drosophila eugracilis TaxID=29029 RepID=UPI0007E77710|nr:transmembrane protein 35A [Drosophila eugracilis]